MRWKKSSLKADIKLEYNMKYTGERLIIDNSGCNRSSEIYKEHIERYKFALGYVENKKVLDIACGSGYGTELLSSKAEEIWGGDIDEESIKNARENYSGENIHFRQMDVGELPFEDNSFELVVSFETIEHIDEYKKFLVEIKRVLKSDGKLILSTPDRGVTKRLGIKNPYHKKEFFKKEIINQIESDYKIEIFGQRPVEKMNLKQIIYQKIYFVLRDIGLSQILKKFVSDKSSAKVGEMIKGLSNDFIVHSEEGNYLYIIIVAHKK